MTGWWIAGGVLAYLWAGWSVYLYHRSAVLDQRALNRVVWNDEVQNQWINFFGPLLLWPGTPLLCLLMQADVRRELTKYRQPDAPAVPPSPPLESIQVNAQWPCGVTVSTPAFQPGDVGFNSPQGH